MNKWLKFSGRSSLLEMFLILGFVLITYKTNVYVVASLMISVYFIFKYKFTNVQAVLFFLICCVIPLYYLEFGFGGAFRYFKTVILYLPFLIFVNKEQKKDYKLLDLFVNICVATVFIQAICYYIFGFEIIPVVYSLGVPRLGAFFEDSNFYSYVVLLYIMFKNSKGEKYNFYYIISMFLSGSLSAIIILILLLLAKKVLNVKAIKNNFRKISGIIIVVFLVVYYSVVMADFNIEKMSSNPSVQFKLWSLQLRFEAQKNAIDAVVASDKWFLGLGPEGTKKTNKKGMNLHNTFLQMYTDMGILTLLIGVSVVIFMFYTINVEFLIVFIAFLFLSCVLEVYYSPILLLCYYLGTDERIKKCMT